ACRETSPDLRAGVRARCRIPGAARLRRRQGGRGRRERRLRAMKMNESSVKVPHERPRRPLRGHPSFCRSPMSNSHVQPVKAIAEDIAHLCYVPDDWRLQITTVRLLRGEKTISILSAMQNGRN